MKTTTETDDRKLAPTTFALLCKLRDGDGGTIEDMEEVYNHAVELEKSLRLLVAAEDASTEAFGHKEIDAITAAMERARAVLAAEIAREG